MSEWIIVILCAAVLAGIAAAVLAGVWLEKACQAEKTFCEWRCGAPPPKNNAKKIAKRHAIQTDGELQRFVFQDGYHVVELRLEWSLGRKKEYTFIEYEDLSFEVEVVDLTSAKLQIELQKLLIEELKSNGGILNFG